MDQKPSSPKNTTSGFVTPGHAIPFFNSLLQKQSDLNARSIQLHPEEFGILLQLVQNSIQDPPADPSHYLSVATEITHFARIIIQETTGTSFYNFQKNINPNQYGSQSTFVHYCQKLIQDLQPILNPEPSDFTTSVTQY
jgi:hypothetical protein